MKPMINSRLMALITAAGIYCNIQPMENPIEFKPMTLRELAVKQQEQKNQQATTKSSKGAQAENPYNLLVPQTNPSQATSRIVKIGPGYNPYDYEHNYENIPKIKINEHPYANLPRELIEQEKASSKSLAIAEESPYSNIPKGWADPETEASSKEASSDDEDWNFLNSSTFATGTEEKMEPRTTPAKKSTLEGAISDLWLKTKRSTQKLSSDVAQKFKELSTKNPTYSYTINNLSGQSLSITVNSKNKCELTKPDQVLKNGEAIILDNITDPNIQLTVRPVDDRSKEKKSTKEPAAVAEVRSWDITKPGKIIFKKDTLGRLGFNFIPFTPTKKIESGR